MPHELSVAIPVFNTDIRRLVQDLHRQCSSQNCVFEILCLDDGSRPDIIAGNQAVLQLPHTRYDVLPKHLGRIEIRHQLARQARYPNLLLLDNDGQLVKTDFISQYLNAMGQAPVLIGGTCYQSILPPDPFLLRWKYGRAREERSAADRNRKPYQAFYLNNIFLPRALFLQFSPPALAEDYGHEDSFFGRQLELAGIRVCHLDNPVLHAGLDPAGVFLNKTRQAIGNLYQLYRQAGIGSGTRLVQIYRLLEVLSLKGFFLWLYDLVKPGLMRNLHGRNPRLWLLDLYKLHCFLLEDHKSKKPRKQERGFSKS